MFYFEKCVKKMKIIFYRVFVGREFSPNVKNTPYVQHGVIYIYSILLNYHHCAAL